MQMQSRKQKKYRQRRTKGLSSCICFGNRKKNKRRLFKSRGNYPFPKESRKKYDLRLAQRRARRNRFCKAVAHWTLIVGVSVASIISITVTHYALLHDIGGNMPVIINVPRKPEPVEVINPGVIARIRSVIEERGFERGDDLIQIIERCENRALDPYGYHVSRHPQDDGTVLYSVDRGIAMFNDFHRSDVSNECAFNIECAINTMIDTYYDWGNFNAWVCADILGIN